MGPENLIFPTKSAILAEFAFLNKQRQVETSESNQLVDQLFNFFMVSNTNNTTFTKPKVGVDTVLQNLMMKFEERREHQGYRRVAHLSAGQYSETTRRNNETNGKQFSLCIECHVSHSV